MSPEDLQQALGEADGLLITVTDRFTAEVLAAYPLSARILANFGVGTEHIDLAAARAHELVVTNTPDVLTDCTADLAMTLLLMVLRRAGEGERLVRSGQWTGWYPTQHLGHRVTGRVLGIVGMGRIGRAMARRAVHGFGMRVLVHSRTPMSAVECSALGVEWCATLEELLGRADIVSLHCPSTEETRGMINAERLAQMRPGSYLVNTARGDLIDDEALLAALHSGHLEGAGLDVFRGEPRVHRGYLELEQVVLLPHLGSATVETREAMGMLAVDNLIAYFEGKEPPNRVA
jgi:lactate dehydrogenase-like 2-hydroxyacid dehydrogenase